MNFKRFSIAKKPFDASRIGAMAFVKGGRPMFKHLIKTVYALGGSINPTWIRQIYLFLQKVNFLHRHGGSPMVVKYLKVCSVVVQQICAGYRVSDLTPLGMRISRSKSGLPRCIPRDMRKHIKRLNPKVVKFYLTLFSMFRDIHFIGKLKLGTITSPSTASQSAHIISSKTKIFAALCRDDKSRTMMETVNHLSIFTTAGPFTFTRLGEYNSSPPSVIRALKWFYSSPEGVKLHPSLIFILEYFKSEAVLSMMNLLVRSKALVSPISGYSQGKVSSPTPQTVNRFAGKLAIKEEAAGKVRVFAMVDPWTQWALSPLHKLLFKMLSKIPMDGTFNQLKPLDRVPWGKAPIYSFDLSAATDRLPLSLQMSLLSDLFCKDLAEHWGNLLTGRSYQTPRLDPRMLPGKGIYPDSVKYTVGQPMGALSSWAMLAITHHYIVQFCAWTTGVVSESKWFRDYAILGDDIIIWNKPVALKYLSVLRILGVEVNLSKSIISKKGTGLEFAKKTLVGGLDLSPIPFAEQSAATRNWSSAIAFKRRHELTDLNFLRFLGYGYKVDPNKNNSLNRIISLALSIPTSDKEFIEFFSLKREFIDLMAHKVPLRVVRSTMVRTICQHMDTLLKQAKACKSQLIYTDCSVYIDSIGPWKSNSAVVDREIIAKYFFKYIDELDLVVNSIKANYPYEELDFFVNSIDRFTPEVHLPDQYSGTRLAFALRNTIRSLFIAEEKLSRIQVDIFATPIYKPSFSPTYVESKRMLKLWYRWSNTLEKIKKID